MANHGRNPKHPACSHGQHRGCPGYTVVTSRGGEETRVPCRCVCHKAK